MIADAANASSPSNVARAATLDVVCIGAVLWDYLGRTDAALPRGGDVPGCIAHRPGGVAMNVAVALRRDGLSPVLLSAVGDDGPGDELVNACRGLGIETQYVRRVAGMTTDRYVAIEDAHGLVAAIADVRCLDAIGCALLEPLLDGRLGSTERPWRGTLVVDGNVGEETMRMLATSPAFAVADLRIAAASPGKAPNLLPLAAHPHATFHLNCAEAGLLCANAFADAGSAAQGLLDRGAYRVVVTDGGHSCCDAMRSAAPVRATPDSVAVTCVTGAGDVFMAAHIAAELRGAGREAALAAALAAAGRHLTDEAVA
ncbi:MAG: PfkB family carbohydrate kinase [Rudaea sp.]